MHYVYLLQSESHPAERYVGLTDDLRARLVRHNDGDVAHTSKFRPWALKGYTAFLTRDQAASFERYLKSGSGRAFANRHLWPMRDLINP
jgi:putative endonuclease